MVAPATVAVGWVVVRFAPRSLKAPLQTALLISAVVVAMSWPALRGYGQIASNPTYLPRDYGTGLALTLAAVWGACGAWALARLAGPRSAPDLSDRSTATHGGPGPAAAGGPTALP